MRTMNIGFGLVLLVAGCDMGLVDGDYDFTADAMTLACAPANVQAQGGQAIQGFLQCTSRVVQGRTQAVGRVQLTVTGAPAGAAVQFAQLPVGANQQIPQPQTTPLQNGVATMTVALQPQQGAGQGQGQQGAGQGPPLSFLMRVTANNAPVQLAANPTAAYEPAVGQQQQGQANIATLVLNFAVAGATPGPQPGPQPNPQPNPNPAPTTPTNPTPSTPIPQLPAQPQKMEKTGFCQAGGNTGLAWLPVLFALIFVVRRRDSLA